MRSGFAAAFLACAWAAEARAQEPDKIHLKNSAPLEGVVVSMTYKEVQYESALGGGVVTSQASKDVREIEFHPSRKAPEYADADRHYRNNDFDEARERFERALRDPRLGDPYKQHARWFILQSLMQTSPPRFDEAVNAARQLRRDAPEGFFLKDSFLAQYEAARAAGRTGVLEETVREFEAAVKEKGVDEWKKNLELLRADLAEVKGDWRSARSSYERFMNDKDPELSLTARLGALRCLAALPDWNSLRSRAESIITELKGKKDAPPRLLLGAYCGLGKALLLGEKRNKDALIEFARCAFDIAPKVGEPCREHEESLALGATACARFATEQKDKEKRDLYRDRALQMRSELDRRYRGTPLMKDVDKEIGAIPK